MSRQWLIREYRESDEEPIRKLFELVFNNPSSAERWAWQYRSNPAGHGIIVLAETAQSIVGQYALIPLTMKIKNTVCLGSLSLDTMVHPDYRGQGMFIALAQKAYEIAAERGVHFVYGFPNENSHYGINKRLGWSDLHTGIPLWIKPLNIESIIKNRLVDNDLVARLGDKFGKLGMKILNNTYTWSYDSRTICEIREMDRFDQRFDTLWQNASANYNIAVVRDRLYLTWRFADKPNESYVILIAESGKRLLGYTVLKCIRRFGLQIGIIVDMVIRSEESNAGIALISAAIKYFELRQQDIVGCLMLPRSIYSHYLRQNGFIVAPRWFLPQKMYLGVHNFSTQFADSYIVQPRNWLITWGDHDVL